MLKATSNDKSSERRNDTRQKIELGGLVVKAGLRHADKAFILGALIEAATLPLHSPERLRLITTGRKELSVRKTNDHEKS